MVTPSLWFFHIQMHPLSGNLRPVPLHTFCCPYWLSLYVPAFLICWGFSNDWSYTFTNAFSFYHKTKLNIFPWPILHCSSLFHNQYFVGDTYKSPSSAAHLRCSLGPLYTTSYEMIPRKYFPSFPSVTLFSS